MEHESNTTKDPRPDCVRSPIIALFPGAFKPPHAGHISAIRFLLEDVQVDRVVVIISNRCRVVPESNLAFDAEAASMLLHILIKKAGLPVDQIDIEIAHHRAISHVLTFLDESRPNSEVVFCVGEEDQLSEDDRVSRIESIAQETGVKVSIAVHPADKNRIHSSRLRRLIAAGFAQRREFFECLPKELSHRDRLSYWNLCSSLPRPIHEIVEAKIQAFLDAGTELLPGNLKVIDAYAVDPVFELRSQNNELHTVKYAGDTTGAGIFGAENTQMPAYRVSVERRATRYLARKLPKSVFHSRITYFDKNIRMLILGGRPNGARSVASEFQTCNFRSEIACKIGQSLAQLHNCPVPKKTFWGSSSADQNHWKLLVDTLEQRTNQILGTFHKCRLEESIRTLFPNSNRSVILHLDFRSENLFVCSDDVAIENFERAGCFGDPAYDIATLITDYLVAGIARNAVDASIIAITGFQKSYLLHRIIDNDRPADPWLATRVARYCACKLLCCISGMNRSLHQRKILTISAELMAYSDARQVSGASPGIAEILRACLSSADK